MAHFNRAGAVSDTGGDQGVIGVILAGGRARRLGGLDKGSLLLGDRPLIEHVASRLRPQVGRLVVSSNRPYETARRTGLVAFADDPGLAGPGAGIISALRRWPSQTLAAVAVDLPLLPRNLVARLRQAQADALCAYAVSEHGHALAVVFRPYAARIVERLLREKRMRIGALLADAGVPVAFAPQCDENVDSNINTWEDYIAFAAPHAGHGVANSARMSEMA